MKVERIIKISEKCTTHSSHLDELNYKKTLDKIISIPKDVKIALCRFLNKFKLNLLIDTVIL